MSKVSELIEEAWEFHAESYGSEEFLEFVTNRAFNKATKSDLYPLVANEVGKRYRSGVKATEDAAFGPEPEFHENVRNLNTTPKYANLKPATPHRDRLEAERQLMDEGFKLDGEYVPWGDATAEQHDRRASQLRSKAGGLVVTAERHEQAAALIRQNGATSLRGVERAA